MPLLNEALASGPKYCRVNAASALRRLADGSSVPFLMNAMMNDDSVSFDAYVTLHRLIGPGVGVIATHDYFVAHRDAEIEVLRNWTAAHPTTRP